MPPPTESPKFSSGRTLVTLIPGDGIGAEVSNAVKRVFAAAKAPIDWEERIAGAEVFKKGDPSGVPKDTIESIARNRVALKGPLETPVGFGEKSANVTLRKLFELYGNVRPARDLPGIPGLFSGRRIDLVIVRENVEDLYAGIEHMQTPGVAQALKIITRKGCEKIVRLAFELARAEGRTKVHCATKANIMKLTEGLLKRTFEAVAPEYPEIRAEHIIVDNCAHQLVRYPEQFGVIVTTNMNGDIISDLTSGLTGGLGLAPSANIGNDIAIFEAVHGSAPQIAGKDIANPTAMLLSGVMMLRHLGLFEIADTIEHALYVTFEEGKKLTVDIAGQAGAVSTTEFTNEVIANLGRKCERWTPREWKPIKLPRISAEPDPVKPKSRRDVGLDVFVESTLAPAELGKQLESIAEGTPFRLVMISDRGAGIYPARGPTEPDRVDCARCRFMPRDKASGVAGGITDAQTLDLLQRLGTKLRWMHVEKLIEIDGKPGYSIAAGEE